MDETRMAQEKPRIRVKLKIGGVEAEIECAEDQLSNATEQLLSMMLKQAKEHGGLPETHRPHSRVDTCKNLVASLWREGWFSVSRTLSDVSEEISRRGYNFHRSAVAHTLLDLVREGYLARMGRPRGYTYRQKRPPT